ncbi:hypothetical protein [Caldivirga maquilingensis]|uniref:Flagellin n=1 Tax=Caldivirga maquilingensis (strain ATCC 700844 / DSM 13496 / JCM 10307 / IC-167) TaxID=397948 RepID=A8MBG1_CALMQ|nr:hypothetical protein [Caldivirga maquilingensis]ABW02694.1 hypothetical protein Cmaq_1877 [Caldivirga maquilingensis IC-167]
MMSRIGQSNIIGVVILIAVVLIISSVFLIYAMGNFNKSAASAALSQVESFLTNVADDVEASMYVPGTVLVYPIPSTGYGAFNLINRYCNYTISGYGNFTSGALVYGIPPGLLSYPVNFIDVIRGGYGNGLPSAVVDSPIVNNSAAPLISIVQFGYGEVLGVSYGTYLVVFPRVMIVENPPNAYIYVPVFNPITNTALGSRTTLIINVTSVESTVISLPSGSSVTVSGECGDLSGLVTVNNLNSINIVIINMTITYR